MTQFHSFLWLSNILLSAGSTSLSTDLLMDTQLLSMWQEEERRCREQTRGHRGKEPVNTLSWIKQTARGNLLYSPGSSAWYSVMTWRDGMGERRSEERACVHTAESVHFTAETNTTLKSSYTPIFFFKCRLQSRIHI